jgi:hypothetical protein
MRFVETLYGPRPWLKSRRSIGRIFQCVRPVRPARFRFGHTGILVEKLVIRLDSSKTGTEFALILAIHDRSQVERQIPC